MTTQDTTPAEDTPAQESEGVKQLREAKGRSDERAEQYRKQLVEVNLGSIGLSAQEGLGIAIAEAFKGEPTVEEITAFAAEKYKYTPPEGGQQVDPTTGQPSQAEVLQQQAEGQQQVVAAAQPPVPDDVQQQRMQQAEAQFDRDPDKQLSDFDITAGIEAKMDSFT